MGAWRRDWALLNALMVVDEDAKNHLSVLPIAHYVGVLPDVLLRIVGFSVSVALNVFLYRQVTT